MRVDRRRRRLLAGGLFGLTAVAGCVDPAPAGDGASTLTLPSVDVGGSPGGPVPVRRPDRVAVIDFFATWCAPCKPEMANLRAVRDRYARDRVWMVSITAETDRPAIERFWRTYDGTWPVLVDTELRATRRYDVTGVPTIVVLTPAGEVVLRHRGLAGEPRLVDAVQTALARRGEG